MTRFLWSGFAGESRAPEPKLLSDGACTISRNQKPGRGDLRPWRVPLAVATVPSGRNTIYRMGRDVASDANYWLSWTGVVHAIRDFSADDTTERTFYTGDGTPKVTDNVMALASTPYPTASRPLGIPAPATAPSVSKDSGSWTGDVESYFYVYTYVSDWGWESAPSPPSDMLDRETDATATITSFAAVPAGNYQVNRIRIYRTQTGESSATEFFFLREIAIGTTSTSDDNRDLGEVLATTTWLPAPDDLTNLTAMWNGMAAGISGNAVRVCEPYVGYAWPIPYEFIPPDSTPVALAVAGQTLVVVTTGRPLLLGGSSADSLDQQPLEFQQACIAARSMVGMGVGVAWASNDGLCWYSTDTGARILTGAVMTREDWLAIRPHTIIGSAYEGLYFGTYEPATGQPRKAFLIDPANPTGIYWLDEGYAALHFDELQDQLYVLAGTNVQRFDGGVTFMSCQAQSKEYRATAPVTMAVAEVVASGYPVSVIIKALNLEADKVNAVLAQAIPGVDSPEAGTLRYTRSVPSRKPFRLPKVSGTDWQVAATVSSNDVAVQGVAIAPTIEELKVV